LYKGLTLPLPFYFTTCITTTVTITTIIALSTAMTATTPVALAFGAIGMTEPANQPTHRDFLPLLRKHGVRELDTARAYVRHSILPRFP
jgi:hypothetical protein